MLDAAAQSVRRIAGVALLAVRGAVRTKAVAALLALLAACVLVLPGAVKGDGTPEGELRILLSYTLGFSFGILCLTTLWSACALFAAEIDSSRIQLSAVKPVRPFEFWMGKWLALLLFNAALLAATYLAVYAQLQWHVRQQQGWAAADCLSSRRVARPLLPTPREEALREYEGLAAQKALPEKLSRQEILRALEEKAGERYDVVNPGEAATWKFRLNRAVQATDSVTVRVRFDTAFSTREQVRGVFRLAVAGRADGAVVVPLNDFTQNEIEFVVDARAFVPVPAGGLRDFELGFRHDGDPKRSSGVMLRSRRDVVLLTAGGTFESNCVRAALVQWTVLALLSALGLALSACFSVPVAAFVATVAMTLVLVGNAVVGSVSAEDEKAWMNRMGVGISRAVYWASDHATKAAPLESLTRGERVEAAVVGEALLWNVGIVPLAFAWLGCGVLRRRELAEVE